MTVPVLLQVDRSLALEMAGPPLVVLAAAAVLTLILAAQWRTPAAVGTALTGALLLVAGMAGDLAGHTAVHDRGETALPTMVMMHPRAADVSTRQQVTEARNRWHLVAAAGQGMLVTGLAAGFVLGRRAPA